MSDNTKSTPPPIGSPCWVEIPAANVQACKVLLTSEFCSLSSYISSPLPIILYAKPGTHLPLHRISTRLSFQHGNGEQPRKLTQRRRLLCSHLLRSPVLLPFILTYYVSEGVMMLMYDGSIGLTGGIRQISAERKQDMDMTTEIGMTIFHYVDSIESVSCPLHSSIRSFGRWVQWLCKS